MIPNLTDLLPAGAAHRPTMLRGCTLFTVVDCTAPHHIELVEGARSRGCSVRAYPERGERAHGDIVRLAISYDLSLFR